MADSPDAQNLLRGRSRLLVAECLAIGVPAIQAIVVLEEREEGVKLGD